MNHSHTNSQPEWIDSTVLWSMEQFTLPQILYKQSERFARDKTAIREKAYGIWEPINWETYFTYTKHTALGLMALGIKRGETVGFILDNGPEWLIGELGTQAAGGVALPLFASEPIETLIGLLNHAEATYAFVQDQRQVDSLIANLEVLPHLRQIVYIDPSGLRSYLEDPRLIGFRQLLELGEELDAEEPDRFIRELWDGKPEDLAVILSTSGTTGLPKLAMLIHSNFINAARNLLTAEPISLQDNWVSISPMAWISEQLWGLGIALCSGLTVNFPERAETLMKDFIDIGPTVVTGSSAFWENLASKITLLMAFSGNWHRILFDMAIRTEDRFATFESGHKPVPFQLRLKRKLLEMFVSKPLLRRIGCSRVHTAYTGYDAINPDTVKFFRDLGLNLKQTYDLTETCGTVHVHREGDIEATTVGIPLPGIETKLDMDREILIKSKSNFVGYYEDPALTEKALVDGWLHTGDAGVVHENGHLRIIGRKHETIETGDGPFSLGFVEAFMKSCPYIEEAAVKKAGNERLCAIIGIDFKNVRYWTAKKSLNLGSFEDMARSGAVEKLLQKEIALLNERLPEPLRVGKFALLTKPLKSEKDALTPTGKARKHIILKCYREFFDAMTRETPAAVPASNACSADGEAAAIQKTIRILTV